MIGVRCWIIMIVSKAVSISAGSTKLDAFRKLALLTLLPPPPLLLLSFSFPSLHLPPLPSPSSVPKPKFKSSTWSEAQPVFENSNSTFVKSPSTPSTTMTTTATSTLPLPSTLAPSAPITSSDSQAALPRFQLLLPPQAKRERTRRNALR